MIQTDVSINDADPNAITIEEARMRICQSLNQCTEHELISSCAALGRVVADNVVCAVNVPSFRASAMDGYAVRVSDCSSPLKITGQSLAGHPGDDLLVALGAQRITTGARVPNDADAVVQQENVTLEGDTIRVNQQPVKGLHIRDLGTDSALGDTILCVGDRVGAAERAILAAHGVTHIKVLRKIKVALFSTGDELVEPGKTCEPGQIFDANRALLLSMLDEANVELSDLGIATDTEQDLQRVVDASADADLVISSGGVSVGDADYVKTVLERNGTMDIWKIAMKPGRPLTFGTLGKHRAFFGLPGNPVSAALTCLMFVKPAIDYLCGIQSLHLPALDLRLKGNLSKRPGRVEYQRAIINQDTNGEWSVSTTGLQDSHVLTSLHKANCLIELPMASTGAQDGENVRVYPFTHFARSPL